MGGNVRFGTSTVCDSSGWISICIIPEFEYYWTNAGYISTFFFIISVYGIFLIKNTKNKVEKIKIAFLVFILGIIGRPLFFTISDDFRFYFTPVTSQYVNEKGVVNDIDKYLESISKYCFSSEDDYLNYKYSKEKMCAVNEKIRSDLGTVENFIKVFDWENFEVFRGIIFAIYIVNHILKHIFN